MKKLAYINLETSGLDRKKDEIIRYTAVVSGGDKKMEVFDKYAKPLNPLNKETESIMGITNDELTNSKPTENVKREFLALIDGAAIVGYNLNFLEKFLGIEFVKKIELANLKQITEVDEKNELESLGENNEIEKEKLQNNNDITIKDCLNIIELFVKENDFSTPLVQKALRCGYPKARAIVDFCSFCENKEKKSNILVETFHDQTIKVEYIKNFFEMVKDDQEKYLAKLIVERVCDFGYDPDEIYLRLMLEFERIQELGIAEDFLLAKSVAEMLRKIDDKPHFLGLGCSSAIAYIIGITGCEDGFEPRCELDPLENGLVFEHTFNKKNTSGIFFGFYVEDSFRKLLMDELIELYGENVYCTQDDDDVFYLSVNNKKLRCYNNTESIRSYSYIDFSLRDATLATFTEDYMNIIHYVCGFSYDKINDIRIAAASKRKQVELDKYCDEFCQCSKNYLTYSEKQWLFDRITRGISKAHCKAWYLASKRIIEDNLLF